MLSAEELLRIVFGMASVGTLLSSLEWLALEARPESKSMFAWQITSLGSTTLGRKAFGWAVDENRVAYLLAMQAFASAFGIAAVVLRPSAVGWTSLCLLLTTTLFAARARYGTTGADQVKRMIFVCVCLANMVPALYARELVLSFLALVLSLAYATSGLIRIRVPSWRNGESLLVVLRQHHYGNEKAWRFGRSWPWAARAASMSVLLFEVSFLPAMLLVPSEAFAAWLVFGVLFHLTNAVLLGLNGFVWAFLAMYPTAIWFNSFIQEWLA